jgi:tRNA(Ile)-lysidine synthase
MIQPKASEVHKAAIDSLFSLAPEAREKPLVVMLSGGGDSTALLLLAASELPAERLSALHVNYGLRGEASNADEQFCRELCARVGCELRVVSADPAPETGNLQDWARELRYSAAERLAASSEAVILTAHTADDQAETVLYRLFASPGSRALSGIPARRGQVVRPLLGLRRAELRDWLAGQGESWREDASNDDPRFARVRARRLLADAESLHPAAVPNLLSTVELVREEGDDFRALATTAAEELTTEDGALDLDRLAELPGAFAGAVLRAFVEARRPVPVPKAARVVTELLRLGADDRDNVLQVEGASLSVRRGRARVIDAQ